MPLHLLAWTAHWLPKLAAKVYSNPEESEHHLVTSGALLFIEVLMDNPQDTRSRRR
ncbi:hypothetical protein [Nitrosospira multiformis]|uniref:hypothetical protein n=1 Tax=Nitrosospira multiformis TaxID=1231 RepID=UPI001587C7EB|nr:hypothetical protein [Nitrosospira multiformis]